MLAIASLMADYQRIHPARNVEAPPTVPLFRHGSLPSEKGISVQHQPPPLRAIPDIGVKSATGRSCLCRCICWTISLIVLLLIIVAATIGILYLVFEPKLPKYSVDRLRITDLRLNFDMTLYAAFNVKITANNPNEKIGIYYEKGGKISVSYAKTRLCQGALPRFYQGHRNVTALDLKLTGQAQSGTTLMNAIQQQQQTGQIPLDLNVEAPVAIKLGRLKMRKVRILGDCLLTVDSLSANSMIRIKASDCKYRLKL